MKIMPELKYTKDHEWVRVEGNKAYIGISDYAQMHLGDIVFAELPEIGAALQKGDTLGTVESVKAATDIYTQVSGTVLEINEKLLDDPGAMNKEPYQNWAAALEMTDPLELDELMDAKAYEKFCNEEEH